MGTPNVTTLFGQRASGFLQPAFAGRVVGRAGRLNVRELAAVADAYVSVASRAVARRLMLLGRSYFEAVESGNEARALLLKQKIKQLIQNTPTRQWQGILGKTLIQLHPTFARFKKPDDLAVSVASILAPVNPVLRNLRAGKAFAAVRMVHPNLSVVDALIKGGVQVFWLEGEHGAWSLPQLHEAITLINTAGRIPLVRLPAITMEGPKQVLDLGAQGVIFPFVHNAKLARLAVAASKYPPMGKRGFGGGGTMMAASFGVDPKRPDYAKVYTQAANENVAVILMIESAEAIANLGKIARVEGISAWFVGLFDLSCSLGQPGNLNHPKVEKALARILKVAKAHRIPVGLPVGSSAQVPGLLQRGVAFFHGPSDHDFLVDGAREFLGGIP